MMYHSEKKEEYFKKDPIDVWCACENYSSRKARERAEKRKKSCAVWTFVALFATAIFFGYYGYRLYLTYTS